MKYWKTSLFLASLMFLAFVTVPTVSAENLWKQEEASILCYDKAQPKEWNLTCKYEPSEYFTIVVEVVNIGAAAGTADDLKGAALNLTWDPRIKNVIDIRFGAFWGPLTDLIIIPGQIDYERGTLSAPWGVSRGLKPPLNGTGVIYEIDFYVVNWLNNVTGPPADPWIRLVNLTALLDPAGNLIDPGTKQDALDGCIWVPSDVAVTKVEFYSPKHCGKTLFYPLTAVFPTWNDLKVDVTVKNLGSVTEILTVKAFWNTTLIGSKSVTLSPGDNATVTFGPFNIPLSGWAGPPPLSNPGLAIPVPKSVFIKGEAELTGDVNPADNEKLYPYIVKLKWPGDATGFEIFPAKTLEIVDLMALTDSWYKRGCPTPDPMYNPQCDFNGDGNVDILDLLILSDWWYKI